MKRRMHIAILEFDPNGKSATAVRARAMKTFLERQGHAVDFLSPAAERVERFERSRHSLWSRLKRRLLGRATLPHLWDFLADQLEPQIRRGRYEVVIGRGQDVAYVLTRPLDCVKILDMANILFLEEYYAWGANLGEVEETFDKETEVFRCVDHLLSPHELLTEFFVEQFNLNGSLSSKVVTVRLGCDPPTRRAEYASPPRIVYAGSYYYIQDPYLLAQLTKASPYGIDCYGPQDPNRRFLPARLNYRGYPPTTGFLADYQFGLITVSRDALRQSSPATKFPYYFAHGLPVLFPAWMKEGHGYPDCAVPFDEESFVERLRAAAEPKTWARMSEAARRLGRDLTWDNTLKPLSALLERGATACL